MVPALRLRGHPRGTVHLGRLSARDRRLPPRRTATGARAGARPESVSIGVPKALTEVIKLGRTLTKRADDVLGYFDRPGTSNGPTEAINGGPEHLRGFASGFAT